MKKCPFCKAPIVGNSLFCNRCGKEIPELPPSIPVRKKRWGLIIPLGIIGLFLFICIFTFLIRNFLSSDQIDLDQAVSVSSLPQDEWTSQILSMEMSVPTERIQANTIDRLELNRFCGIGDILDFQFSPDERFLVARTSDGYFINNLERYTESHFLVTDAYYRQAFSVSSDGKYLAIGGVEYIRVLDMEGNLAYELKDDQEAGISALAFSKDNTMLASGTSDGMIRVWNLEKGNWIYEYEILLDRQVDFLEFSPDNTQLISANATQRNDEYGYPVAGEMQIWKLSDREFSKILPTEYQIQDIQFSPDGSYIYMSSYGRLHNSEPLYELQLDEINTSTYEIDNTYLQPVQIDDNNYSLLGIGYFQGSQKAFLVVSNNSLKADIVTVDMVSGETIILEGFVLPRRYGILKISDEGSYFTFLIKKNDNFPSRILIGDFSNNEFLLDLTYQPSNAYFTEAEFAGEYCYNPRDPEYKDDFSLVLEYVDGHKELTIRENHQSSVLSTLPDEEWIYSEWYGGPGDYYQSGHDGYIEIFSTDGKLLVMTHGNIIEVFQTSLGTRLFSFDTHEKKINDVLISSDNKYLVSTSEDNTIRIWDLQNGNQVKVIEEVYEVYDLVLSVNDQFLYAIDDDEFLTFSIPQGEEISRIKIENAIFKPDFAVSPDAELLVYEVDNGFEIMEINSQQIIRRITTTSPVTGIWFTQDGKSLAIQLNGANLIYSIR